MGQESDFIRLREAYEQAYREWRRRASALQELMSQSASDPALVARARHEAQEAEQEYEARRDMLAAFVLTDPSAEGHGGLRSKVEAVAYRLWEERGRGSGNAEADWYRAEEIVLGR